MKTTPNFKDKNGNLAPLSFSLFELNAKILYNTWGIYSILFAQLFILAKQKKLIRFKEDWRQQVA